jgi:hypothetical protein
MNQLVESKPTPFVDSMRRPGVRAQSAKGHRLRALLRKWWQHLWMDDMTSYLSHAESAVELEYRIRHWNEHDRRGGMPLL